jgi:hypothetical protein
MGRVLSFNGYIRDLKRGLRKFALYTADKSERQKIENRLKKEEISYFIWSVKENNINVFFGNKLCVKVVKRIGEKSLSDYTPEEDFILGTLLGYGLLQQCQRFLDRKEKA